MRKKYVKPGCFKMPIEGCVILSSSEPEVTSNIGAKEGSVEEEAIGSSDLQYEGPNKSLWGDDED